jgi:hypothetical protein
VLCETALGAPGEAWYASAGTLLALDACAGPADAQSARLDCTHARASGQGATGTTTSAWKALGSRATISASRTSEFLVFPQEVA